ncbi:MAG: bifunctional folylpolyglutamate synthase/dihydrofolate synthase [Clostridiales bacterium]|nr:bifunctional folylpolyglutamate synthase/dihydrofolate synthase [Clostridiales bacterium]
MIIDRIHEFNKFGMVLGLSRMEELLRRLGDPQDTLNVIHVAGTNGKGSVSKYLEEGLAACGYKMGLYTSPYIEKFNERIRFDGADISDEDLEYYGQKVVDAAEAMVADGKDSPTEFEVVTAIAFLYFAGKKADITILEVGLGGIGDSTNVVKHPLASVITSISYDHMAQLGNTLAEIAVNKAGIIKTGCPVISNVPERDAAKIIARKAYAMGSRLFDVSGIRAAVSEQTPFSQVVSMELYEKSYSDVEISMVGKHQAENLKTALATLEILRKSGAVKLDREALYAGLKRARQPGRFEVIGGGPEAGDESKPLVIIDGAHNEAGAQALQETMAQYFAGKKILLVAGILADKQIDSIIKFLTKITDHIIVTEPDNPRKLAASELAKHMADAGVTAEVASDAEAAMHRAKELADGYDVILFAGSLYLIGDVRRLWRNGRGEER